jgi:tetratricopeptide (TPR) repeat protein
MKGGCSMRLLSGSSLAVVAMFGLSSVACSQAGALKAKMTLRQAHEAYQTQDYKKAAELYEQTLQSNPDLAQVYFYLGNSYDNLYKPGLSGRPENDALLEKAVKNYQMGAEKLTGATPDDLKLKKLTLQYLAAAYGSDKLNDPVKAEPIIQGLIKLDPTEAANYFALGRLYEDAGVYDEAEKVLLMAKDAKPNDPTVYTTLASYYNRQGAFDKTIGALEERAAKEPNNPEAFHLIATYYWDEGTRDARLTDKQKGEYIQHGLEADDKALKLKPDFFEAMTYKGLLLRLQANIEKDPGKQQSLLKEATALHDKAEEIRKKKATGVGD